MGASRPETHHVLITANSEYHVTDGVCIAVRDHRSGEWRPSHCAVGGRIVGTLRGSMQGIHPVDASTPTTGDRVIFSTDVVTSPVRSLRTEGPEAFDSYPTLGAA
ncbi:MAG: hypothetical protein AAB426_14970 [Myxococcota bacterium]